MSSGPLNKNTPVGNVVLDVGSPIHALESGKLNNATAGTLAAIPDIAGYPVVTGADPNTWNLVQAGGEATATGVVAETGELESLAAATASARDYTILARGPATVNKDALPAADSEAAAYDADALAAGLLANSNINSREESNLSEVQTT